MTERPTRLFVPPTNRPQAPLQTIAPPPALSRKADLLLATAAIDHSGRIPARRLLRALAWSPGDPTSTQLRGDVITLRLDPKSPRRIDSRHHVFVPLGLRDLTGIRTADHIALLAVPQEQVLLICPARVLRSLMADHLALKDDAVVSQS